MHLSDLHFGRGANWERQRVLGEDLLRKLSTLRTERDVDLLFITGDIAFAGRSGDYEQATKFVESIRSALHLAVERIFVVPGNHDIDRTVSPTGLAQVRKDIEGQTPASLPKVLTAATANIIPRQAAYRAWVRDTLKRPTLVATDTTGYRETLELSGRPFPVQVIGLDTAWLSGGDDDHERLALNRARLGELLHDDDGHPLPGLRLGLCHHPFSWLRDGRECENLARDHLQILFRGHLHQPELAVQFSPGLTPLKCVTAGALFEPSGGDMNYAGFELVDLELDLTGRPVQAQIHFWGWRGDFWAPDNHVYPNAANGLVEWKWGS
ncbi:metallophosphoesterase family protein [Vulgatibacter incomptus]|uniref:metallophosphoesterase family protein n=1 Tax=Vulgatibacter incomptus TaxID=1391653 RepID=UPI00147074B8|nr:metallophosphoesterase [Vulgatibacter incomptus]